MGVKSKILIGTSGWSYAHWKENFFPPKLKSKDWLAFFSERFSTVEVNTTFYHTPKASTVENWFSQVPDDFVFSIKATRYITHLKRLHDCKEAMEYFYKSIKPLKHKIGVLLFQLPPSFQANQELLLEFISLMDKDYRHTFEFRHESWFNEEIYAILKKNKIAITLTDLNGKPTPEVITAPFTYLRLHGPHKAYVGSYGPKGIKEWHTKIDGWKKARKSVYCYFDNDEKGFAIQDAKALIDSFK